MRQKRAKAYRKLMSMYHFTFGFREPYQVLVDSEMCKTAISQKVDLAAQLETVLQGTVKPMITQCCIHELYLQGKAQQPAVDLAKSFERRRCNHKEAIPGDDCLLSVIGDTNKHRYVIATLSNPLRSSLRSTPGVPVLHLNRTVLILEPPSDATLRAKALAEQNALAPSASEAANLKSATVDPQPKKKKKGPKGPNPLSVKKKKTSVPAPSGPKPPPHDAASAGQKRKRNDDVAAEAPTDSIGAQDSGHGGHKRKRRRKDRQSGAGTLSE
ncbi:Fcf1-domain-containing protein [Vararia minispora EC-137]|uniref:Fcf1-domain-containing protein n=1 Tax=Vararia minispora EC-137 TaxID=1314806 RepID=A0ACB8QY16_9AGAM|nr:Fcf1-domain-containing protein [Vararia minispora EC-137]